MNYAICVTREGDQWLGEVPGMPGAHSYAGNLTVLEERMREAIAAVEDLAEGAEATLDLTWDYSAVSPLAVEAARLAVERHELEARRRANSEETRRLIAELVAQGWSTRDAAGVLGVTPGYVSQTTNAA